MKELDIDELNEVSGGGMCECVNGTFSDRCKSGGECTAFCMRSGSRVGSWRPGPGEPRH